MSDQTSVTAEIIPFPSRRPAPHGAMTGRSACGERSRGWTRRSPDSARRSPPGAARSAS